MQRQKQEYRIVKSIEIIFSNKYVTSCEHKTHITCQLKAHNPTRFSVIKLYTVKSEMVKKKKF